MKHRLKPSQYAILICVMLTASVGDTLLAHGMKQVGPVDLHHLSLLWHALFNPFVDIGIILLIGFFACYMTALSFADLTFVMPATAFGYVANSPSRTEHPGEAHHELPLMDSGVGR